MSSAHLAVQKALSETRTNKAGRKHQVLHLETSCYFAELKGDLLKKGQSLVHLSKPWNITNCCFQLTDRYWILLRLRCSLLLSATLTGHLEFRVTR